MRLLDNQIRYFIQQSGSKEALEEVAGKTIYQIKEDNRAPFREQQLAKTNAQQDFRQCEDDANRSKRLLQ